jgi:hypothetical protein
VKLRFKIALLLAAVLVTSAVTLNFRVRHERNVLQSRAKVFLSRPVPQMFQTHEIGGFGVGPDETVLSDSRTIVQHYAVNGQFRQTSANAAAMALSQFEIAFCGDAAKTNKVALNYVEECKAIRDEIWRTGEWWPLPI